MTERVKRCGGVTKAGKPCLVRLNLSEINGRCLHHDPLRRAEAKAVARLGGKAQHEARRRRKAANPANMPSFPPSNLERVALWLRWIVQSVASGGIDARTGGECTKALKELRGTLERLDLEKRVRQLEADLKKARREAGVGS